MLMLLCRPGSHTTSVAALGRRKKALTLSICFDSVIPLLLVRLLPEFCPFAIERHAGVRAAIKTALCARAGTSESVVDYFALTPPKIEQHFGISRGHIHCVDNGFRYLHDVIATAAATTVVTCTACCCTGADANLPCGGAASWHECRTPRQCLACTQPVQGRIRQALSWAAPATTAPGRSSRMSARNRIGRADLIADRLYK